MTRVSRFLRSSMAIRLLGLNLALNTLVFGVFGWWFFQGMRDIGERAVYEEAQSLAAQSNGLVNGFGDQVRNALFLLAADRRLMAPEREELLINYLDSSASYLRCLFVIEPSGQITSSKLVLGRVLGTPEIAELAALAQQNPGRVLTSAPYYSRLSGQTVAFAYHPPLSLVRPFRGTVAAEVDLGNLSSRVKAQLTSDSKTVVICTSANQPLVFPSDSLLLTYRPGVYPPEIEPSLLDSWNRDNSTPFESFDNVRVVRSDSNEMGWPVYAVFHQSVVEASADLVSRNLRVAFLGLILLLVGEALFISFYISSPLRGLVRQMDKIVGLADLKELPSRGSDEIGSLVRSYNALIHRVILMADEVRESEKTRAEYELKMLQSQIGPHFLYNTLACIGNLASRNKIPEVRSTIRSLVDLLSFTFDRGAEMVTIREELVSVEAYTAIQTVRYGPVFTVQTRVSPEAMECLIPRLTLQPLVENALFHGLVPRKTPGTIRIVARVHLDQVWLWVGDNGVGFREPDDSERLPPPQDRLNSIGIANVDRRLKARFGKDAGLTVFSKKGVGTAILLRWSAE